MQQGDSDAVLRIKEQLAAAKAAFKEQFAAARAKMKADRATAREALKQAAQSLRGAGKDVETDVRKLNSLHGRATAPGQRDELRRLIDELKGIGAGEDGPADPTQIRDVVDRIRQTVGQPDGG